MSTLKVDTILKRTGTGTITLGQSGDTIDLSNPTSVTLNSTMKNRPALLVTNSGNQSIGNASNTLVTFDTETLDTNSAFASNVFTVPSGEGGMYFISFRGAMQGIDAGEFIQLRIYLNGSAVDFFENRMTAYTTDVEFKFSGSGALNLSAADTISYYVYQNSGDSQNLTNAGLYMFKLIGV